MARVLLAYASMEGQTERIAERIAEGLRQRGHEVDILGGGALPSSPEPGGYDGILVGASVHRDSHPALIADFVRKHREALESRASAFFSVSLSAGGPTARPEEARGYVETFFERTGWRPQLSAAFAGALRYSRYPFWKRFMMRRIMKEAGGDTDSSRDHEYTDWAAVEQFAHAFADRLPAGTATSDGGPH